MDSTKRPEPSEEKMKEFREHVLPKIIARLQKQGKLPSNTFKNYIDENNKN